jgi:TPR repeat protein
MGNSRAGAASPAPFDCPVLSCCREGNAMRHLLAAALAIALSSPLAAQDFDKGWAAYQRGDYATALQEWRPLAEQGQAAAQYRLGVMYAYGIRVEKDFKEARRWYEKAARQGDAPAAYELGVLYELGRGVLQDERQAAYWFHQGALRGHRPSQEKFSRYEGFLR